MVNLLAVLKVLKNPKTDSKFRYMLNCKLISMVNYNG